MTTQFLTQEELANRWGLAPHTLSQWRWNGRGPVYHKIGKNVLYSPRDIEQFEMKSMRISTSQNEYFNREENYMNGQK